MFDFPLAIYALPTSGTSYLLVTAGRVDLEAKVIPSGCSVERNRRAVQSLTGCRGIERVMLNAIVFVFMM
jgi:hypothetical protein